MQTGQPPFPTNKRQNTPPPEHSREAAESWDGGDRRADDRRHRPTRPWTDLFGPLRRESGRRDSDQRAYVDRYTGGDVALVLAVFLMNVCDAFFTMMWLDRGGREANPVMDFFLDIGPGAFLIQKCFVVGLWLLVLLMHKNFKLARIGLYAALVVYGLLLILHFTIVAFGIEPPKHPQEVQDTSAASSSQVRPIRFDQPATE